jgi:hypothetical protein
VTSLTVKQPLFRIADVVPNPICVIAHKDDDAPAYKGSTNLLCLLDTTAMKLQLERGVPRRRKAGFLLG